MLVNQHVTWKSPTVFLDREYLLNSSTANGVGFTTNSVPLMFAVKWNEDGIFIPSEVPVPKIITSGFRFNKLENSFSVTSWLFLR